MKPHERGHKPRGRRPANPDAPRKPRTRTPRPPNTTTNTPRRRGKAKLLMASLRQGRASMAPLRQAASQPQPGIHNVHSELNIQNSEKKGTTYTLYLIISRASSCAIEYSILGDRK